MASRRARCAAVSSAGRSTRPGKLALDQAQDEHGLEPAGPGPVHGEYLDRVVGAGGTGRDGHPSERGQKDVGARGPAGSTPFF